MRRRAVAVSLVLVALAGGGCVRAARTEVAAITAPAMRGGEPGSGGWARATRTTEIIALGAEH